MPPGSSGSRRPIDSAFRQQRLKAWQPILTPRWVIGGLLGVGVVFIPIGIAVLVASTAVVDVSVRYDEVCKPKLQGWNDSGKVPVSECVIDFKTSDDDKWVDEEVHVYYQLDNFYQNHRQYVASRAANQLIGSGMSLDTGDLLTEDPSAAKTSECKYDISYEDRSDGNKTVYMYPCGLIAKSIFNDTLYVRRKSDQKYIMWNDENIECPEHTATNPMPCPTNPGGVAWPSDVDKKYASPSISWIVSNCKYMGGNDGFISGFIHPDLRDPTIVRFAPASNCGAPHCGRRVLKPDGTPNDGIYNCWHNTTDQDFIVWMRVAALPSFKKLYRRIPAKLLEKNTEYELVVYNRFPVHIFGGTKRFVMSTGTWVGGKNDFLGYAYVIVGGLCVLLSLVFLGKHMVSPRIMGDPRYLNWK